MAPSTRSRPARARRRSTGSLRLDRILGATVHSGQELVVHLDQLVQQGFPRFDQIAGDEGIPFGLGKAAKVAGVVAAAELPSWRMIMGSIRRRSAPLASNSSIR